MMNAKKFEKEFQKILHPDIKDKLFVTIEDYNFDTDEGIVVFLDEYFDEFYTCDPRMIHHLQWYLSNPKKNYTKALMGDNPLTHALVIIDKQTGKRTIDDWSNEKDELLKLFYELRKKYQS
jgi:hypothetical protein